jgi:SAM-dependent methyltransferase
MNKVTIKERIATRCVCCETSKLNSSPAILMPFVAHRALGWEPVEITPEWGLKTIQSGMAYSVCRSLECVECGHLFLDIRFDDYEMARLYGGYREEAYTELRERYEPGYKARNEELNAGAGYLHEVEVFLSRHVAMPTGILDWGGDTGKNTPFKSRASHLHIYDISEKEELLEGAMKLGRSEASKHEYGLVVCSNVLEHVPYPRDVVLEMKAMMKPGTVLYIEVPQETLVHGNPEGASLCTRKKHWHEHVNFFTESSLKALVEGCGLSLLDLEVLEAAIADCTSHHYMLACALR